MKVNELTRQIIGAAIEVHRELGPGKPEITYEAALARELGLRGLACQEQKPVPVIYKGVKLECGYRLDLLVAETVVVEIKAIERVNPVHRAQVLTYLKLGGSKLALLLNFNVAVLKEGIERFVLGLIEENKQPAERRRMPGRTTSAIGTDPLFNSTRTCGNIETEQLARVVIASAGEVYRELGPGLLASAYKECLCHELHLRGVAFERQRPLPLSYKGVPLPESDEVQLLVAGRVVVEPQALMRVERVHQARLLSQLRLGGWKLGLLINFNAPIFADVIRRFVRSGND
jgi:GxxExxY protein